LNRQIRKHASQNPAKAPGHSTPKSLILPPWDPLRLHLTPRHSSECSGLHAALRLQFGRFSIPTEEERDAEVGRTDREGKGSRNLFNSRSALSLSSLSLGSLSLGSLSLSALSLLDLSWLYLCLTSPSLILHANSTQQLRGARERESTEDVNVGEVVGAIMRRDLRRREGGDR
jgi:hypothetical protein